ncbi:hypothetical protein K3495_g9833 [Podosphaera aphanis]|nr:hypothetical protein K3495_g9833 [Podosphaera aphanis]
MDQKEKQFATKSKLSKLEEFVARQVKSLPQALQPGVIPANRQLPTASSRSRDRPTVHENKYKTVGMPAAATSLRPIINGSKPHNPIIDGPLCINCGDFGHRRRECHNPSLPNWEQAYLNEIVFRPISPQSSQSYFYQMEFEDEQSYTLEDDQPTNGPISEQPQPQYRAPTCYNVDLLRANSETSPTPGESNEDVNEPIADLSSLIAESAENSRKRVRIDDILNDKHDFRTPRKRSARTNRGEAKVRKLREIVGRRGRGPVDYNKLAEEIKIPINFASFVPNFSRLSEEL